MTMQGEGDPQHPKPEASRLNWHHLATDPKRCWWSDATTCRPVSGRDRGHGRLAWLQSSLALIWSWQAWPRLGLTDRAVCSDCVS